MHLSARAFLTHKKESESDRNREKFRNGDRISEMKRILGPCVSVCG